MKIVPLSFYQQDDILLIAKQLIGKQLFSDIDNLVTGGIITETEAYRGAEDKACHAFNHRRTPRTEVMFREGGIAYVYLCYGMHNMLNVVTAAPETPHAVLIRAILPTHGIDTMLARRKKQQIDRSLTSGPGSVCQALGITRTHNGLSFQGPPLWIEEAVSPIDLTKIVAGPRIGVDYAEEHALLPWRFILEKFP
jgi:DNA-3-methyladenine glycosylase